MPRGRFGPAERPRVDGHQRVTESEWVRGRDEGGWQRRIPGSRSRTICGRSLNQTQEHLRQGTAVAEIRTQHAFLCQKRGGSQIPILEGEIKSPSYLAERIPACLPNNIGRRPSPPLQIAERSQNSGKERILRVKLALSVRPSEFMRLHALSGRPFWSVGRSVVQNRAKL